MDQTRQPFPEQRFHPFVKICGITRVEDARLSWELGASFLGIILTADSKRHLAEDRALELVEQIRQEVSPDVRLIGVFVDEAPDTIRHLYDKLGLAAVQIHADVTELRKVLPTSSILPALAIATGNDASAILAMPRDYPAIVTDTYSENQIGGTGRVFNHRFVQPFFAERRIFIAGGIHSDNIQHILSQFRPGPLPYAFDLSSGVEESPGIKNHGKLRDFFTHFNSTLTGITPE